MNFKSKETDPQKVSAEMLAHIQTIAAQVLGPEDAGKVTISQTGIWPNLNFRFAGPTDLVKRVQAAIDRETK